MDALNVLRQDHQKLRELFREAEEAKEGTRCSQLFIQFENEWANHTYIEETFLYAELKKQEELKHFVDESLAEHREPKTLLQGMQDVDFAGDEFNCNFMMLFESVRRHLQEEEAEMFPKVRELLDAAVFEELKKNLEAAKVKEAAHSLLKPIYD
jgi:hemerythrin superfamily protein